MSEDYKDISAVIELMFSMFSPRSLNNLMLNLLKSFLQILLALNLSLGFTGAQSEYVGTH